MTPPAYTQSVANDEVSVDAEAVRQEKPRRRTSSTEHPLHQTTSNASSSRHVPQSDTHREELQIQSPQALPPTPPDLTPCPSAPSTAPVLTHYLTEPVATADLVGVRPCSILQDRPAIWLIRRKKMALSPLAAAVLLQEGLIRTKNLELSVQASKTGGAFVLTLIPAFPSIQPDGATLLIRSQA